MDSCGRLGRHKLEYFYAFMRTFKLTNNFISGTSTFYIDGKQSGDPQTLSSLLIEVRALNQIFIGFDGHSGTYCDCDIAQLEIYDRALSEEEIKTSFGRFAEGDKCP